MTDSAEEMDPDIEVKSLRRLLDIGRQLLSDLDPEAVLLRILEEAREITGARYGALGVLDQERAVLARFLTSGTSPEQRRVIGALPRGHGVLGVLISDPEPLRVDDVRQHPQSFGFPQGHPVMRSFLGVPILIRGRAWGNLYLTEKVGELPFSSADEEAVTILSQYAAVAIENAQLYAAVRRDREQLTLAVEGLEAARTIADAISIETDLERILELVVKRGRALVNARSVLILLRDGPVLRVAASAGIALAAKGHEIPVDASTSGDVLHRGVAVRVDDASHGLRVAPSALGAGDARTALIVPISHRGDGLGVLMALDRGAEQAVFTAQDEELLRAFAASAANAVALSRSVEADRLRTAITSAEDERRRWARELHDQTLQSIGGVRVLLSGADLDADDGRLRETVRQAVEDLDVEIENLRGIIADLRPSILDDLGLRAALGALIAQRRAEGLEIRSDLRLPDGPEADSLISAELQTTLFRLVQEALTNTVKHAHAQRVWVGVRLDGGIARVNVRDDGVGFDAATPVAGFGLMGIRERVYLAGGELSLRSDSSGTELIATIPAGG